MSADNERAGSAGRTAGKVAGAGRQAADSAEDASTQAMDSKPFRVLLTVGLIAYGIVHILIGWIALQIAWTGGGGEEASQKGALAEMSGGPFGSTLLWITVVGLFALTIWQAVEAIWGHRDKPAGGKRIRKRVGSAGRAFAYAAIAFAAISTLSGTAQSGEKEEGWTARLLSAPFGRVLVIALGVGIIVLGVRLIRRGVTKKFTDDLAGGVRREVIRLGQVGYIVKGVAFLVVGGLFGWAAITFDAEKAGGLDDALRTVHDAPFGSILLTLMALGLICFGVYCFFWARNPKVSTSGAGGNRGRR